MKKYIYIVIFIVSIFLPTYAYPQGLGNGSSPGGTLTSPKIITSILDTNGNILLGFTATASAVNYLQYANGAAGSSPTWTATGSDTDIGELHILKGLGNFTIKPGTDEVDTLDIQTAAGGHAWQFGTHPGAATFGNMWPGNITPNTTNYALSGDSNSTILNALTTVFFRIGGATQASITSGQMKLGLDAASPTTQTLTTCGGLGADKTGCDFIHQGGPGTGTGAGGSFIVKTAPAGSSSSSSNAQVTRFTIDSTGLALFTDKVTSSRTTDLGWSVQAAANQACNTTCTSAAVVGFDAINGIVDPTNATADQCLCAGAS